MTYLRGMGIHEGGGTSHGINQPKHPIYETRLVEAMLIGEKREIV